jgi:DNA transformation protein
VPDNEFLEYVLDQLQPLGPVLPRAMFGSHGLYRDGVFFGILAGGRVYFKTDERTRRRFEDRGSESFHANMKQTLWSYYEVPSAILDDPSELASWAEEAVDVQRRSIHKG